MTNQNQWRAEMDSLEKKICEIYVDSMSEWSAAKSGDSFAAAYQSFSPDGVSSKIRLALSEFESWFTKTMMAAVLNMAKAAGLKGYKYKPQRTGWLTGCMASQISSVKSSSEDLKQTMGNVAIFFQENSGLGAAIKSFAGGFLNPIDGAIDGVMSIFGEGRIQKEGRLLDAALAEFANRYVNSFHSLVSDLDAMIIDQCNSVLHDEQENIQAEVDRLNQMKELAAYNRVPPVPQNATTAGSGISFGKAAILVVLLGVVIVGGIALLKRFGFL